MIYEDINTIVARHFDTTPYLLMHSFKEHDCDARAAAFLICHLVLDASTLKLARWYGKRQHTTPMRAMRTAGNLVDTNKEFRSKYKASLFEVQATINAETEKKVIKQIYNLNHRVRKKGIVVCTRSRTLSITEAQLKDINDPQLTKLLTNHHYTIQLSIL